LDRAIGSLVILAHTILYEFKSIKFQFHSMHTIHTKLFLAKTISSGVQRSCQ